MIPQFARVKTLLLRFLLISAILIGSLPGSRPVRAAATLQAMIDAAQPGASVNLPAGTYLESLTINKSLFLNGNAGGATILQPPAGQPGIRLLAGADKVVVMDLTITGATAGGITSAAGANSALTLWRCTLSNNSATYGGGIFMGAGGLEVFYSVVLGNTANQVGGGIYAGGLLTMLNTTVSGNTAGWHGGGVHGQAGLVSITGGSFEGNTATSGNGGGLNVNDHLTLSNTTFSNNVAGADGGGVLQWNEGKTIQLNNVTFQSNRSKKTGGGMAAKGNMTVTGGAFLSNTAGDAAIKADSAGGGLYLEGGALDLTGTRFQDNQALCNLCNFEEGGGLAIKNPASNTVKDAVFRSNHGWFGGGIYQGRRQSDTMYGTLTLLNSTFSNNQSGYGGGIYAINATVTDSLFEGNSASNNGGGLLVSGQSVLEGVRILGNAANGYGTGLQINGSTTVRNSAISNNTGSLGTELRSAVMIEQNSGQVLMEQVTIANNTGGNIAGLLVKGGNIILRNAIIANQSVGVCLNFVTPTPISLSIDGILWNGNGNNTGTALPECTVAPQVSGPKFGSPAFAADGYHITVGSAAYNAGIVTSETDDIDGDARPLFGAYDLGADELVYKIRLPAIRR